MRIVALLSALLLLGCGSIIDPAPYDPARDSRYLTAQGSGYTTATVLKFTDLSDASAKLRVLANGYADERDAIMRQQVLFDVSIIGLTTAAVVNPVYHGARAATIGLGLGAATVGAARMYLGPQVRVSAYNGASSALGCATSVADEMAILRDTSLERLQSLQQSLRNTVAAANALLTGGGVTGQAGAALLAARDRAQTALEHTRTAVATLRGAHGRLQTFAVETMRMTTNKVMTGVQNLDATLAAIRAAVPAPTAGAGVAAAAAAAGGQDAAAVTRSLDALATEAEQLASSVNEVWGRLQACALGGS